MRKSIILILILFLCTACAKSESNYEAIVEKAMSRPLVHSISRTKEYLKYYVLPDVGVRETTEISSVFEIEGFPIVMTLNVADIIAREYYDAKGFESKIDSATALFSKRGTYVDRKGRLISYVFNVVNADGKHIVILENHLVTLMGVVEPALASRVVDSMFVTLRSVEANELEIANLYSNKEIVDYKAVHEEFFNHKIPESGTLYDIYNQLHPNDAIEIEDDSGEVEESSPMGGE